MGNKDSITLKILKIAKILQEEGMSLELLMSSFLNQEGEEVDVIKKLEEISKSLTKTGKYTGKGGWVLNAIDEIRSDGGGDPIFLCDIIDYLKYELGELKDGK